MITGDTLKVEATIPVGKRPRGIHASPDGKTVYVALSGTPISAPPKLDANGNPIFQKGHDDDDDDALADKKADGIGVVDVAQRKFLRKIPAGSALSNSRSVRTERIFIFPMKTWARRAFSISPKRKWNTSRWLAGNLKAWDKTRRENIYVTCETAGLIYAIDTHTGKEIAHLSVHPRPRSVDFLPDGSRAFIPSESVGELNVIDAVNHKLLQVVALPKGFRPMCVKVAPDSKKVYVSAGRSGCIAVVDAATGAVLTSIKVWRPSVGNCFFSGWSAFVYRQRPFGRCLGRGYFHAKGNGAH